MAVRPVGQHRAGGAGAHGQGWRCRGAAEDGAGQRVDGGGGAHASGGVGRGAGRRGIPVRATGARPGRPRTTGGDAQWRRTRDGQWSPRAPRDSHEASLVPTAADEGCPVAGGTRPRPPGTARASVTTVARTSAGAAPSSSATTPARYGSSRAGAHRLVQATQPGVGAGGVRAVGVVGAVGGQQHRRLHPPLSMYLRTRPAPRTRCPGRPTPRAPTPGASRPSVPSSSHSGSIAARRTIAASCTADATSITCCSDPIAPAHCARDPATALGCSTPASAATASCAA